MRNFKDIIVEKLKVTGKMSDWTKTFVPTLTFKTLSDFGKLFIE